MRQPKNPYKRVSFKWVDAVSEDGWKSVSEAIKERPHPVSTKGYILHEDEYCIIIGQSVSYSRDKDEWEVNGSICIPKVWANR